MQPKINISYTLGHFGSVSALFYVESEIDVYGWHVQAKGHYFSAAFFMIENFYTNRATLLYRSLEDDVYGPWVTDFPPTDNAIRSPLPEPVRHELERIQSKFVEEWLFFENDPVAGLELTAYAAQQLPVHAVNVKSRKINRLEKRKTEWEHSTPGIDSNIIDFLQKYWRHEEKTTQLQSLDTRS
jgi:hypothetical protein